MKYHRSRFDSVGRGQRRIKMPGEWKIQTINLDEIVIALERVNKRLEKIEKILNDAPVIDTLPIGYRF